MSRLGLRLEIDFKELEVAGLTKGTTSSDVDSENGATVTFSLNVIDVDVTSFGVDVLTGNFGVDVVTGNFWMTMLDARLGWDLIWVRIPSVHASWTT